MSPVEAGQMFIRTLDGQNFSIEFSSNQNYHTVVKPKVTEKANELGLEVTPGVPYTDNAYVLIAFGVILDDENWVATIEASHDLVNIIPRVPLPGSTQ